MLIPQTGSLGGRRVKWIACFLLVGALPLIGVPADGPTAPNGRHYSSQPLVTSIYTADPSAHVFDGRIYVYPSHDVPTGHSRR